MIGSTCAKSSRKSLLTCFWAGTPRISNDALRQRSQRMASVDFVSFGRTASICSPIAFAWSNSRRLRRVGRSALRKRCDRAGTYEKTSGLSEHVHWASNTHMAGSVHGSATTVRRTSDNDRLSSGHWTFDTAVGLDGALKDI